MQFITTIPMLTTEIENGAWYSSIKSKGSRFYHNPSPPPSNQCWGIWQGFWQHDSYQHCVGGKGFLFLLNQTKCTNHCFQDCRSSWCEPACQTNVPILPSKPSKLESTGQSLHYWNKLERAISLRTKIGYRNLVLLSVWVLVHHFGFESVWCCLVHLIILIYFDGIARWRSLLSVQSLGRCQWWIFFHHMGLLVQQDICSVMYYRNPCFLLRLESSG